MPLPTSILPLLPFFFFIFFSLKANSSNSTAFSTSCYTNTTCGGKEIRYPFWKFDTTTTNQYCGYSGFGIECSPLDEPIIYLAGDRFYVDDIDYVNSTVTLIDIDVTTNQSCPRAQHNFTLEQDHIPLYLNSSYDFNLTFYFNCSEMVPLDYTYAVTCLQSGRNKSFVSLAENEMPWYGFCEKEVVATVKEVLVSKNQDWVPGFGETMNKGFCA